MPKTTPRPVAVISPGYPMRCQFCRAWVHPGAWCVAAADAPVCRSCCQRIGIGDAVDALLAAAEVDDPTLTDALAVVEVRLGAYLDRCGPRP